MLAAALRLAELGVGISLPEAMKMTSLLPARAAGLEDRGEIAPGKRADLIRVRLVDGQPVVRTVYAAGERVASSPQLSCAGRPAPPGQALPRSPWTLASRPGVTVWPAAAAPPSAE